MHGWYDHDWGFGNAWLGGLFMAVAMLLFWGGLITAVLLVIRHYAPRRQATHEERDTAMRVLDERFARGEIDAKEYQERRDLLGKR